MTSYSPQVRNVRIAKLCARVRVEWQPLAHFVGELTAVTKLLRPLRQGETQDGLGNRRGASATLSCQSSDGPDLHVSEAALCLSVPEKPGGGYRNRTGLHGFAIRIFIHLINILRRKFRWDEEGTSRESRKRALAVSVIGAVSWSLNRAGFAGG